MMKKIIPAVTAALCTLIIGAMPVQAKEIIYGDVNGDGVVDSVDSSEILSYYSLCQTGADAGWSAEKLAAGDVDGDGMINSSDASIVLAYYSYLSTRRKDSPILTLREYLAAPAETPAKPASSVIPPSGLDPGTPGSIEYIINTAPKAPHDTFPLYNIKGDNENGGKPYLVRYYTVSEDDKAILEEFAKEHFTDDMTYYDRLRVTWEWLHFNVRYADGQDGRPSYNDIIYDSFTKASFVKKAGQCIQYNGAFAAMMAYMGYDVYMLEKWNRPDFTVQHFQSEVMINGLGYNTEVGETTYDSPEYGYYWMWLFDHDKQQFFGLS